MKGQTLVYLNSEQLSTVYFIFSLRIKMFCGGNCS